MKIRRKNNKKVVITTMICKHLTSKNIINNNTNNNDDVVPITFILKFCSDFAACGFLAGFTALFLSPTSSSSWK